MRVIKIFCFVLLFPLVIVSSQASLISGAGCVYCEITQRIQSDCCKPISQPDCCATTNYSNNEKDGDKTAQSGCPHAGLCQGDTDFLVQMLPVSVSPEVEVPLVIVSGAFKSFSAANLKYTEPFPPPLKRSFRLFTLNCSLLI